MTPMKLHHHKNGSFYIYYSRTERPPNGTNISRLWKWSDGGLSLSAVANNGIKNGRLNYTGEIYLTNCIEFIPTTQQAEKSYEKFIEDKK